VITICRIACQVDTSNLSEEAKKTTEADVEMLEEIESRLGIAKDAKLREKEFSEINSAKGDVSAFDCSMLLRKDRKVTGG
jgi:inorganic pyrophosphatase/exopolyphosphatase